MISILSGYSSSNVGSGFYYDITNAYSAGNTGSASNRAIPVPSPISLSNLWVSLASAPGVGTSVTLTVIKNGSPTSLSVTISGSNTSGSDQVDAVSFNAGDTISIESTTSGSPALTKPQWTMICTSLGGDSFPILGAEQASRAAATSYSIPRAGSNTTNASTEAQAEIVVPCAGTISNLYASADVAPGVGNSMAYTLVKNGSPTALTCTISGSSATTANDTIHSVSVNAGDTISMQLVAGGTPSTGREFWGLQFTPATPGQSFFGFASQTSTPSTSATNYEQPLGIGQAGWSAAATNAIIPVSACTIQGIYASLGTAPGGSASWTLTVQKNGSNTAAAVTVSGSNTTGNTTGQSISANTGDTLTLACTPASSPAVMANGAHIGILLYIPSSTHELALLGAGA